MLRRAFLVLLPILAAVVLGGCSLGFPTPATRISDRGVTLNASVLSNSPGVTEFWWRYGPTGGYGSETSHRTVATSDQLLHAVSQPVAGLTADASWHFQICARDVGASSPQTLCNQDFTVRTKPTGGRSGIAVQRVSDIWVVDADGGNPLQITDHPSGGTDTFPTWSPDGTRIAFARFAGGGVNADVFSAFSGGSNPVNLTNNAANDFEPSWSPDGSRIAFISDRAGGRYQVWVMNSDGTNPIQLTSETNGIAMQLVTWSPDATRLAFTSLRDGGRGQIYVMNADGSNQHNVSNTPTYDSQPAWSPDGTKFAFLHGSTDLWVMNDDGTNQVPLDSDDTNRFPSWSPNGSKIALHHGPGDQLWTINANGTGLTNLTNAPVGSPGNDWTLSWSPRP